MYQELVPPLWTTLSSTQCDICEIIQCLCYLLLTDKVGVTPLKICSYNIEIKRRVIPWFAQCPVPSVGEIAGLYCHAKQNASMSGGRRGFAVCQRQRLHGEVPFTAHRHYHCLVQRRMRRRKTTTMTRSRREKEKKRSRNGRGREGGPMHTTFLKCH